MSCKLSIICCYNKPKILEEMLIKSINSQHFEGEIELVAIDNSQNRFSSNAEALNYGARKSSGEYLIFAHQDIEIFCPHQFSKIVKYLDDLKPCIIGFAGIKNGIIHTNLIHGQNKEHAGDQTIINPVRVETLDEVLIAIKRDVFEKFYFDEITCNDWHLYVVDLCLTLASSNIPSYVIPTDSYHLSSGDVGEGYYKTMKYLVKKHRKNHKYINSTCTSIPTSIAGYNLFRLNEFKNALKWHFRTKILKK